MKQTIIDFISSLISVILGIVITFSIQGMIDRAADRNNVRSALELVRSELTSNKEDIAVMKDYLRDERNAARYFLDHQKDLASCPADSVRFHNGIIFADASLTTCQDALELLKMSSLFQKLGNNPLSMKIIRAYDACESITTNLNRHIEVRNDRFERSVTEQNIRKYASSGWIEIRDYLKTDFGFYTIHSLAHQADPDLFADLSDLDEAIEAIGEYLDGGKRRR